MRKRSKQAYRSSYLVKVTSSIVATRKFVIGLLDILIYDIHVHESRYAFQLRPDSLCGRASVLFHEEASLVKLHG